jgi:hypothetical protein
MEQMVSINCGDVVELEVRSELGKHWVTGMVMELGQVEGESFAHVRANTALSDVSFWLPVGSLTRTSELFEARVIRTAMYTEALRGLEEVLDTYANRYEEEAQECMWVWGLKNRKALLGALRHMEDCPYDGTIILQ